MYRRCYSAQNLPRTSCVSLFRNTGVNRSSNTSENRNTTLGNCGASRINCLTPFYQNRGKAKGYVVVGLPHYMQYSITRTQHTYQNMGIGINDHTN